MVHDLTGHLDRHIEEAEADPRAALDVARASTDSDPAVAAAARHLEGLAHRLLGDFDASAASLDDGFDIATRLGDGCRAGRILLARSTVRLMTGDVAGCQRDIDAAGDLVCHRHRLDLDVQAGAVAHRLGDHDAAEAHYRAAERRAVEGDRPRELARVESNLGLLLTHEGRIVEAGELLARARERFDELQLADDVLFVEHNLGYLRHLEGDIVGALRHFDAVTTLSAELGVPNPTAEMDRAAVLSTAGLFVDALEIIAAAIATMDDPVDIADAELVAAEAALAIGDFERSRTHAEAALNDQERHGRRGWVATAELAMMRARAGIDPQGLGLADVERLVSELRDVRLAPYLHGALALGADVAIEQRHPDADSWIQRSHAAATTGQQRATAHALTARRCVQTGDDAGAIESTQRALDHVDAAASDVGSLDLWLSSQAVVRAMVQPAIVAARHLGDEAAAVDWVDRGLAATVDVQGRRIDDEVLRAHHAEARRLTGLIRSEILGDADPEDLDSLLDDLERVEAAAVDRTRLVQPAATLGARGLVDDVEHTTEIVFAVVDGDVERWVLDGSTVRVDRVGPAESTITHIESAHARLRRDFRRGRRDGGNASALASLDSMLFDGIRPAGPCTIVVDALLGHVPLAALESIRDVPFVVAPSRSAGRAARERPLPTASSVTLIAGPGLPAARDEIGRIAEHFGAPRVVLDADRDDVVESFTSEVVHLACHGDASRSNPLFMRLALSDGPITFHELQVAADVPSLLVLSACDLGESGDAGADATADVVLATLGVRTVVSAGYPVNDDATADVMDEWYRRFAAGLTAAEAWAELRVEGEPIAAAFTVRGADSRLVGSDDRGLLAGQLDSVGGPDEGNAR